MFPYSSPRSTPGVADAPLPATEVATKAPTRAVPRRLLDLPVVVLQEHLLPHVMASDGDLFRFSLASRATQQLACDAAAQVLHAKLTRGPARLQPPSALQRRVERSCADLLSLWSGDALLNGVEFARASGNFFRAQEGALLLTKRWPQHAEFHTLLGHTLAPFLPVPYDYADYEDAVASYRRAIALDPCNTDALFSLGEVLDILGDDARACFARVLTLAPEHVGAKVKLQMHAHGYDAQDRYAGARSLNRLYVAGDFEGVEAHALQLQRLVLDNLNGRPWLVQSAMDSCRVAFEEYVPQEVTFFLMDQFDTLNAFLAKARRARGDLSGAQEAGSSTYPYCEARQHAGVGATSISLTRDLAFPDRPWEEVHCRFLAAHNLFGPITCAKIRFC